MELKVLMYGWEFPPRISGGLGVACHAIVKELAKKNVDLTLVLPQSVSTSVECIENVNFVGCEDSNMLKDLEIEGAVKIKHPNIGTYLSPYVTEKDFKGHISTETVQEFLSLLSQMRLPEELKEMARLAVESQIIDPELAGKYKVDLLTEVFRYSMAAGALSQGVEHDVIHSHDWLTVLAALEAKRFSDKPVVLHVHALETDRSGLCVDKRIFAIEKYGMEQVDRIIAVSKYTKDNIVKHYGIDPRKISIVHNGIYCDKKEASEFKKDGRPKMVLFLGRITHQKGPCFFIDIAKKILEKKPDVHFVLAGTGDLLIEMIEKAASLRIGKNVHFLGFLDSKQVQDIYELADVYVMPSVSEPFGLSALEALSCGVPAVISKQSGVSEVLKHTLVADFWDTDNMAAKILALLDHPVLGEETLVHTQGDLEVTTWANSAEKIINVYRELYLI